MDLSALRLATDMGGQLLLGPTPAHALVLVERIQAHGLPCLLVLGRTPRDLEAPLEAMARSKARINLTGALPARTTILQQALAYHKNHMGSLLGALDAGLPWLGDRPMMPKRLPGRLRATGPLDLEPASLRPLEKADLEAQLGASARETLDPVFLRPRWNQEEGGFFASWWPGVPKPDGAEIVRPCLTLPSNTPFTEALRASLRLGSTRPVPWLPHPEDPAGLQALAQLTTELAGFRGSTDDWGEALDRLADLPAPPHFCSRC